MGRATKINKKSINLIFLGIDIIIVLLSVSYSIKIIQAHLPSFSDNIANQLKHILSKDAALILFSLYELFILYLSGVYRNKINLSISNHLSKTLGAISITYLSLFIYFFGFYNLFSTMNAWNTFLQLTSITFIAINASHIILILTLRHIINKGQWYFRTVLIGSTEIIENNYDEIVKLSQLTGNRIVKVINIDQINNDIKLTPDNHVANFNEIGNYFNQLQPEEIIITVPSSKEAQIANFISVAKMQNIPVKLIPDMESIMKDFAKIDLLTAPPYVYVPKQTLPVWQELAKRFMDIIFATIGLIAIIPFVPFIVFNIKRSSEGPLFYQQPRIGKNGKPFNIIKFRTMYVDAEKNGPDLSSINDQRVTSYGRFLRRWRIDETPQFINVLLGQMSLVGPRPERSYFINKISQKAPNYSLILQTRPGITSLGMVKYGYAENVEQMLQRLNYDLLYMENISIWLDIKILIYTLKTIISGEGK